MLEYWLSKRGNRRIPYRSDIDPAEIPDLLPNVFLMDVDRAARRFRMRLAGTAICEAYHRDITGQDFEEIVGSDAYEMLYSQLCEVAFFCNIHHTVNNFDFEDNNYLYERILLPLLDAENVVTILIGIFVTSFKIQDLRVPFTKILNTADVNVVHS